jgi:hypothetical protein
MNAKSEDAPFDSQNPSSSRTPINTVTLSLTVWPQYVATWKVGTTSNRPDQLGASAQTVRNFMRSNPVYPNADHLVIDSHIGNLPATCYKNTEPGVC